MKTTILLLLAVITIVCGHAQTNLTKAEYFLDSDLGVGLNTIVTISEGQDITEAITATIPPAISIGKHKLYFRTKDANNHWSHTTRKNIEILKPQKQNNILVGEYFLDTDLADGSGISFEINPQNTDITQAFMAQIPNNTAVGYHKLYGRVKDAYGNWGFTFRKNIQVVENDNPQIVKLEYFFGNDLQFGNNTEITIETPEADGTWNFYVPYPAGPYNFEDTLFVRVQDSNGKWSITAIADEIDPTLSVVNLNKNDFVKIYPNPVKDVLNISSSTGLIMESLVIYDLSGKQVFISTQPNPAINLSHLNSGMYLLKITTNVGMVNHKFIKQ